MLAAGDEFRDAVPTQPVQALWPRIVVALPDQILVAATVLFVWVAFLVALGRLIDVPALLGVVACCIAAVVWRLPPPTRASP